MSTYDDQRRALLNYGIDKLKQATSDYDILILLNEILDGYDRLTNSLPTIAVNGSTALECTLKLIINSDQGAYEKLYNIKALLEVK